MVKPRLRPVSSRTSHPSLRTNKEALKEKAGSKVLFSAQGTNVIINGLAGHAQVLQSRRQEVLAYMRALNKGLDFANSNPDQANQIIADWVGSTPAETVEILEKLNMLDLADNKSIAFGADNKLNVASSFDVEVEDLDYTPFDSQGGRGRMWQLFGEDMNTIISELNEVLAA